MDKTQTLQILFYLFIFVGWAFVDMNISKSLFPFVQCEEDNVHISPSIPLNMWCFEKVS